MPISPADIAAAAKTLADVCTGVAQTRRGQISVVEAWPGSGVVYALTHGLPDFGIVPYEIEFCWAAQMSEGEFVEMLNGIRLRDQLLVLSGVDDSNKAEMSRVRNNVEQCFTRFGGRAVMVVLH